MTIAPAKRPPMKVALAEAARIASHELKRRIPQATIRSWRHRELLLGGRGWVDGINLDHFLMHLKQGDPPMIASKLAKRSDLMQHGRVFAMPADGSCGYCHAWHLSVDPDSRIGS